jgi:hypothetical protein
MLPRHSVEVIWAVYLEGTLPRIVGPQIYAAEPGVTWLALGQILLYAIVLLVIAILRPAANHLYASLRRLRTAQSRMRSRPDLGNLCRRLLARSQAWPSYLLST